MIWLSPLPMIYSAYLTGHQAEDVVFGVGSPVLSFERAIQEVGCVELDARLIGVEQNTPAPLGDTDGGQR